MPANPARGEADARIGGVAVTIAVTFAGLAKVSQAIKAQSLDEVYRRLIGFEPFAVICALPAFAAGDDPEKARANAMRAVDALSAADETAWREAITFALTHHLDDGRKRRGDKPLSEIAGEALGEPDRP